MPRSKEVIGVFFYLGKPAHPFILPESLKRLPASGQKFMRVGLMADIPDHLIMREIKDIIHGNGQLNYTET